jgi:hypothetical protein
MSFAIAPPFPAIAERRQRSHSTAVLLCLLATLVCSLMIYSEFAGAASTDRAAGERCLRKQLAKELATKSPKFGKPSFGRMTKVAFGDVTGDGRSEAAGAYVIGGWQNGNGYEIKIAVCSSKRGVFRVIDILSGSLIQGDVQELSYTGDSFLATGASFGPNDAHCCPTQSFGWYLGLRKGRIVILNGA